MKVLRCAECGLPFATVQNGAIIIQSMHSGKKHHNVVAIAELVRLAAEEKESLAAEGYRFYADETVAAM